MDFIGDHYGVMTIETSVRYKGKRALGLAGQGGFLLFVHTNAEIIIFSANYAVDSLRC